MLNVHIILFVVCLSCMSNAFPVQPTSLNQQNDFAWQAWLLVDDNKQEGVLRRRITPKSIFVSPTFKPEKLRECPDSNPGTDCLTIIQLNEEKTFDFLLEKLSSSFGDVDYVSDNEEPSSPLQLNIPLDQGVGDDEKANAAIIVTPSKGFFDDADALRLNETVLKKAEALGITVNLPFSTTQVYETTTLNTKDLSFSDEDTLLNSRFKVEAETTTFLPETTTLEESTTTNPTTTTLPDDITTITESAETTTEILATMNVNTEEITTVPDDVTTTETTSDATDVIETTTLELETTTSQSTTVESTTLESTTLFETTEPPSTTLGKTKIKFPGPETAQGLPLETGNTVRFPESPQPQHMRQVRFPHQELTLPQNDEPRPVQSTTKQFENLFSEYINSRASDLTPRERQIFKSPPPETQPNLSFLQEKFGRNRERLRGPERPLVLRFARKNIYIDTEQLSKAPHFYREVPPDDLSYIFGFKHRSKSLR